MSELDFEFDMNPYDSFMRKHLQYYGYYTGRNAGFRQPLTAFEEWDKNHDYAFSSDSDIDGFTNENKDDDSKTQEELLRTTQLLYSCQAGKMVPRLREPRSLYGFNASEYGAQQAPKWPAEIQVLPERVKHIDYIPPEPEPLYKPTGMEKSPLAVSHESQGKVVYEYQPVVGSYFLRSRVGGYRGGCSQVSAPLTSEDDPTLTFESRFESANLAKAVKVKEYEYELYLRNDLYTSKHTQWYYFRVSNTKANATYRFTIVNLVKSDSLYKQGMRPLMYSEKSAKEKKVGWVRAGSDIKYYRNNIKYYNGKTERSYYSLTWTYTAAHDDDKVYFTHCYPYTYSDLQDYLTNVTNDPVKSKICKERVLCRTLAGNLLYVLTITSPSKSTEEYKKRKAVVITARVHPGETNSSWMMKGFLDYLLGNSADAKLLRDTFIFKIVPMLNPDGVIVGNYRCSLAGCDLNRNYKTVLKDAFPSIWYTRTMIKKLLEEREVVLYCDLHGHSRKQNAFIYGCENRGVPERRLRERIFPVMLSKNAPDQFSFDSCKFKIQKSKEGTGRIVMWHMGIMNSYTLEATFCGSSLGNKKGYHFSTADFESMGYHFCDTLLDYCDPDGSKCAAILLELEERIRAEILQHLQQKIGVQKDLSDINLDDDYTSEVESSDGGSDSSVSDGLPVHLQYPSNKPTHKKKRLKTRKERHERKCLSSKDNRKRLHTAFFADNSLRKPDSSIKGKPIKYTTGSGKHSRSREDREKAAHPVPIYTRERVDERQIKKVDGYLEALTGACLNTGVIIPPEQKEIPHFRYTAAGGAPDDSCAHRDQSFAVHYVTNHLQQFSYPDNLSQLLQSQSFRGSLMGKPPDNGQSNVTIEGSTEGSSRFTWARSAPVMGRKSVSNKQLSPIVPYVRAPTNDMQTHMTKSEADSMGQIPFKYRLQHKAKTIYGDDKNSQRHLVEVSAAQQRQQDLLHMDTIESQKPMKREKTPLKQHPPPFDDTLEKRKPYDYVRTAYSTKDRPCTAKSERPSTAKIRLSSASSLGRETAVRHVQSLATMRRPEGLDANVILGPAEEGVCSDKINTAQDNANKHPRRNSASKSTQYTTENLTVPAYVQDKESRHSHSHHRSRKSDMDKIELKNQKQPQPPYVPNQRHHRHGNVPKATDELQMDMPVTGYTVSGQGNQLGVQNGRRRNLGAKRDHDVENTVDQISPDTDLRITYNSINELRDSLLDPSRRGNLSPTTGNFIEHFVKKTEEEISDIAAELEDCLVTQQAEIIGSQETSNTKVINNSRSRTGHLVCQSSNVPANSHKAALFLKGGKSCMNIADTARNQQVVGHMIKMGSLKHSISGEVDRGTDCIQSDGEWGRDNSANDISRTLLKPSSAKREPASPTKISLMISRSHHENQDSPTAGQFHAYPLTYPKSKPPLRNVPKRR